MTKNLSKVVLCMMTLLLVSFLALAQEGGQGGAPKHPMTFFRHERRDGRRRISAALAGADAGIA